MNDISREKFLKLLAAGGASFLGISRALRAQGNAAGNVDLNGNGTLILNGENTYTGNALVQNGMLQQQGPVSAAASKRGPLAPWARLKFTCRGGDDDDWNVHPNGDLNLIDVIREHTTANVRKHWNVADVSELNAMTAFPFLFMHSEMGPELEDDHRKNLREYLLRGGFLFAEDCVNGKMRSDRSGDEFFRKMVEEFAIIMPEGKLEKLPYDHPVFHCFHHFDNGCPHMQGKQHGLHSLTVKGRVVALLSPSDLHCGWTNGDQWFSASQQQKAFQMGTNIYLYAMTQDAAGQIASNAG